MKKFMVLAVILSISLPISAMQDDSEDSQDDPTTVIDELTDAFGLLKLDFALPPQPQKQSLFSLVQQRQLGRLSSHVFEQRALSIISQPPVAVAQIAAAFLQKIKFFYKLPSDAPVTSVYRNFSQCLALAFLTGVLDLGGASFAGGNKMSFKNGPCFKFFSEVFLPNYGHSITSISLSYCKLDAPPEWLERCPCLVRLALYGNPLDVTSKNFKLLRNVSHLGIGQCNLLMVPEDLQNMPQLCWLDVCENREIQIPDWFGSLHLTTLKLAACNLQTIPACIRNMTTLQYLDVSLNSDLDELPEWLLTKPPHLTKINLWLSGVPMPAQVLLLQKRDTGFSIKH